jgi:hypothetical protein
MPKVKNGFNVNKNIATLKRPIADYFKCCFGYKNQTGTDKIINCPKHDGVIFYKPVLLIDLYGKITNYSIVYILLK